MVEMGCCAALAPNQEGPHSAAATRSTMHTAAGTSTLLVCGAHCALPTAHCPPSVSSPSTVSLGWSLVRTDAERVLHAISELVPGDDAPVGRVLHVLPLVPLVNKIIAASTVVPLVSVVCCAVRPTEYTPLLAALSVSRVLRPRPIVRHLHTGPQTPILQVKGNMQAAPEVPRDTHEANAQNAQGTVACPQSHIRAGHAERQ